MIGSGRKVLAIYEHLEAQGMPRESFERVYASVELDITAVTPEEIAIAIVSEL